MNVRSKLLCDSQHGLHFTCSAHAAKQTREIVEQFKYYSEYPDRDGKYSGTSILKTSGGEQMPGHVLVGLKLRQNLCHRGPDGISVENMFWKNKNKNGNNMQ